MGRTLAPGFRTVIGIVCALSVVRLPARAAGGQDSPATPLAPLTLDHALALASHGNRLIQSAAMEVDRLDDSTAAAHTQLLPAISVTGGASQLLAPVDFHFPQGAFGTYPQIGPVPASDLNIRAPARLVSVVSVSVTQPITQLPRIRLGIKAQQAAAEIAREGVRLQSQATAADVKQAFFGMLETQSALDAKDDEIRTAQELLRLTQNYVAQRTALDSDLLGVQARIASLRYDRLKLMNDLITARERLNDLMGRDLDVAFLAVPPPDPIGPMADLKSLQALAVAQRPEIRQSAFKLKQAGYDRAAKATEYMPDVSIQLSYSRPYDLDVLPGSVATAGVLVTWTPFDWGNRRYELQDKSRVIDEARIGLEELETQVRLKVADLYRRQQEALALDAAARAERDAAKERLRVATDRYQQDAALLKDVLEAQSDLASADHDVTAAEIAMDTASAGLEKAIGSDAR